ncbi:MAG: hypothetical protein U0325_25950 [Polyangiales bacterium]
MNPHAPDNDDGVADLVEVEVRPASRGATVRVRSLRTRAALLSIRCGDDDATAFAVLCAERFCAERALPLVMRPRRAA